MITRWEVRYAPSGGSFNPWVQINIPGATYYLVVGLANGVEYRFQLRAANSGGVGPEAEIRATPAGSSSQAPFFEAAGPTLVYRVGVPVETSLPAASAAAYYSVSPNVPNGLTAIGRFISGTPTTAQPRSPYTLTAFNAAGENATLPFTIEVLPNSTPEFTGTMPDQTYRVGAPVDAQLPMATGGDGELAYALAPALPQGLSLDSASLRIVGTPTAPAPRATYTYTATDEDGDAASLTFAIQVLPNSTPEFTGTMPDQTYRVGAPVDAQLPMATGGDGELAYALAPALPQGLSLDSASLRIVGTPTAPAPRATYTYTATDEDGDAASLTFAIQVLPNSTPAFGEALADQTYNRGTAIIDLALPAATGGDGSIGYALSPALPAGLTLNADSRTIAGTPNAEWPRTLYTWTATDEDGDAATLTFAISVAAAVTIAIADAAAGEGTALSFPVAISDAVPVPVTVAWRTMDGTAKAGEDYTAASGTLTFPPGTTQLSIDVAVSSDSVPESDETFAVALANPLNAEFGDNEALGTILDNDVESARGEALSQSLAAFGRAFAADAVDAVSGRFLEGSPGGASPGTGYAGRSQGAAIAATVGRFFGGVQEPRHAASGNPAALMRPASPALHGTHGPAQSGSGWLGGALDAAPSGALGSASFQTPFAGSGTEHGKWTLWGRGSTSRVSSEDEFSVDGRIDTGYIGVDARLQCNVLAGMAVARSTAEFDYEQASLSEGDIDLELTTLLPYVHWTLPNGLDLWAMAGAGSGDVTLEDAFGEATTDMSLRLGAFGLRHELAKTESLNWALKADAVTARLRADGVADALDGAKANTERLRLLVEGRREWARDEQSQLGASFELGARLDGGDADTGVGAEVGATLDYRHLPLGLGLEARGRYLLAHADGGFDQWGLSAALEIDPGTRGSGASMRIAPAWGAPGSGVADLWRADRMVRHGAAGKRGFGGNLPARVNVEVGYGFALKHAGPLRLFGVFNTARGMGYRLGVRSTANHGLGWSVEIDRVPRLDGQTDHGILLHIGDAPANLMGMADPFLHPAMHGMHR